MAIGPIKYNGLSNIGARGLKDTGYTKDSVSRDTFPENVGTLNPIHDSFGDRDVVDGYEDEKSHAYEFINKFKVCDIALSHDPRSGPLPYDNTRDWGNWRTITGIIVSPNVFLFPEQKSFEFSYEHKYGSAFQTFEGGLIGKIRSGLEAFRSFAALNPNANTVESNIPNGGKFMSRYHYVPQWDGTQPISIPSNLKFNFSFGQAGLFNGELEVVRPILALAKLFELETIADKQRDPEGNIFYVVGPMPTGPHYMVNLFAQAGEGLKNAWADFNAEEGGVASKLTAVESSILSSMETAIDNTLKDFTDSKLLNIRIGRMVYGPLLVKNVAWSFDFTQVDEYGFPYKGSVTYSGLESIMMPIRGHVDSTFVK